MAKATQTKTTRKTVKVKIKPKNKKGSKRCPKCGKYM